MTTRREQINKLSPEEYERAVVRSATLAFELAKAQGQKPSIEVESILEKAKKTPGAIAKERSQGGWSVRISDGVTEEAVRKSGTPRGGRIVSRSAVSGRFVNRSAASGSLRKKA